jgi:hypothetical protein
MSGTDISDWIHSFKADGARSTLFQVIITNPVNGEGDKDFPFRVTATDAPPYTLNEIAIPAMGRHFYVPGHRTMEVWNTTILEDEDMKVRNALEEWSNKINGDMTNKRDPSVASSSSYKTDAHVMQYNKSMEVIRTYILHGVWPVSIGAIRYSWDTDAIVTYDCSFRFDTRHVEGGTGNAGGKL